MASAAPSSLVLRAGSLCKKVREGKRVDD